MEMEEIFSGTWKVSRTLNAKPFLEGDAVFRPVPGTDLVHYREEGSVHHPNGFSGSAFREYYFAMHPGGFRIFFDREGRKEFNTVTLKPVGGCIQGNGTHECGRDIYRSQYLFEDGKSWQWINRVKGPKKDYVLHSEFRRPNL